MDLIIGGVYQGKLDYAKMRFDIPEKEVFHCTDAPVLDCSVRCIDGLERYLQGCLREGVTPDLAFRPDAVIICEDLFCGMVSADAGERVWREFAGRTLTALAARADRVTRIFCGLPQQLKP